MNMFQSVRTIYISCEVLLDNPTIWTNTFRGQQKKKRYIEVRDDTRAQKKKSLVQKMWNSEFPIRVFPLMLYGQQKCSSTFGGELHLKIICQIPSTKTC